MDKKGKINTESFKSLKELSETYASTRKSIKSHKNSHSNDYENHSHKKINSPKKNKRRFSPDVKKTKKMKSIFNEINSTKHNHPHHHKSSLSTNKYHRKYNKNHNKSQEKQIKKNLVSQKFKIATDFNEKNSNKFLDEKDECLREVILSDEIEEEEIPFFVENEKGSIYELSSVRKDEEDDNLSIKRIKRKKNMDYSLNYLLELIDDQN